MPQPNTQCKVCGIDYYSCKTCDDKFFKWKSVACSVECFQKYMGSDLMSLRTKSEKLDIKYPLRGVTYEDNQMHDFSDYHIVSETNNWLFSSYKNRKYEVNDIQYFYIPRMTFLDIIEEIRKDAFEEGVKSVKGD